MPRNGGVVPMTGFKSDAFAQEKPRVKAKRPWEDRMAANCAELRILKTKLLRPIPPNKVPRIKARIDDLERVLKGADCVPCAS